MLQPPCKGISDCKKEGVWGLGRCPEDSFLPSQFSPLWAGVPGLPALGLRLCGSSSPGTGFLSVPSGAVLLTCLSHCQGRDGQPGPPGPPGPKVSDPPQPGYSLAGFRGREGIENLLWALCLALSHHLGI